MHAGSVNITDTSWHDTYNLTGSGIVLYQFVSSPRPLNSLRSPFTFACSRMTFVVRSFRFALAAMHACLLQRTHSRTTSSFVTILATYVYTYVFTPGRTSSSIDYCLTHSGSRWSSCQTTDFIMEQWNTNTRFTSRCSSPCLPILPAAFPAVWSVGRYVVMKIRHVISISAIRYPPLLRHSVQAATYVLGCRGMKMLAWQINLYMIKFI